MTRVKVLIVEDDRDLAESLRVFFEKKGAEAVVAFNIEDAEHKLLFTHYDLLLVDLVLPPLNGVEFLKSIISHKKVPETGHIWAMSGILKKRIFSQDIFHRINEFFSKPLDWKILENKFNSLMRSEKTGTVTSFFYFDHFFDVKSLLNQNRKIEGHQLMFIYLHLLRQKFTGSVNLLYEDNKKVCIFFENGCVCHIDMDDKMSYLGILLVKKQLISAAEVKTLLREKSDIPLGERLILNCAASPHLVEEVISEQILIRLKKTMDKGPLTAVSLPQPSSAIPKPCKASLLSAADLTGFLDNWVESQVPANWLENFFTSYSSCTLLPRPVVGLEKLQQNSKYIKSIIARPLKQEVTVKDIINGSHQSPLETLREMYVRILLRDCILRNKRGEKSKTGNYSALKQQLDKELQSLDSKNYFQWLGLDVTANEKQIETKYRELVKIMHTDRRDKNMPQDLSALYEKYFLLIKKSYETLMDSQKRKFYIEELKNQREQEWYDRLQTARDHLRNQDYKTAYEQLKFVKDRPSSDGGAELLYIWAHLKNSKKGLTSKEDIEITDLLSALPDNQKNSALFFFVKGLYTAKKGDKKNAWNLFSSALKINPQMTSAYQERRLLQPPSVKKKKSFFGGFFKKGA